MTGYQCAYGTLVLQLFLFSGIAVWASKSMRSARSFFHYSSPVRNTLSLVAANLTLGTGMIYLVTGGEQHGVLMFLVPLCTFAGYAWLASEFAKTRELVQPCQNILIALQKQLDLVFPKDRVSYASWVTGCLVFTYTMVFSFELLASAHTIAPFLAENPGPYAEPVIAFLLFLTALFTVLLGGIRGVFRTDMAQVGAIVIVVVMLVWTMSEPAALSAPIGSPTPVLKLTAGTIAAVAIACMQAISTQLYSMLNWSYASHLKPMDRPATFRIAGFLTAAILAVLVACGVVAQARGYSFQDFIASRFRTVGQGTGVFRAWLPAFLVMLGLTSVVCSTCDSLIIGISQFVYDNVLRRDSSDDSESKSAVMGIRFAISVTFVVTFVCLAAIYRFRQNLFELLLTMAAPVVVFTPLFLLAGAMLRQPHRLVVLKRWSLGAFVALYIGAAVLGGFSLLYQWKAGGFIGLVALSLSVVLCVALWLRSGRYGQEVRGIPQVGIEPNA